MEGIKEQINTLFENNLEQKEQLLQELNNIKSEEELGKLLKKICK